MINLFFVVHDYFGARTYANELLGYLAKQKGIVVHNIHMESNNYKEYTETEERSIINIHIPVVKREGNSLEKYSARCVDLMSPLLRGKENLIFHLNYCTQVKLGVEVRNRFNARIIYTLHYLPHYFSTFAIERYNPKEVDKMGDVLDREILAKADHIICVTRFARETLSQHFFVPKEKMTIIYNGYSQLGKNEQQDKNKKESIKKLLGFSPVDRIILFVGRLENGKGLEKLIKAFDLIVDSKDNQQLVIVGTGDFSSFLELCQENIGRIRFTGKLPKEKVRQLYHIADIGVIPSEFEQCSYVALEMMQHSLPIVCSDAPGLKELFTNGENALIAPLQARTDGILGLEITATGLYKTIKQLHENQPLAKQLASNALKEWEKHYTTTNMGQTTLQLYQQLQTTKIQTFEHETI